MLKKVGAFLVNQPVGVFAEFERALIRERQREGIALAKQRGTYRGRKRSLNPDQVAELKRRVGVAERDSLLSLPEAKDELIRLYTFSETDLALINQRRGRANRLGFAVHLCYLRFPGGVLSVDAPPFPPLLRMVAQQLNVPVESWDDYGQRDQTRREHLIELQTVFGFKPFTTSHYRQSMGTITELALQTDKGLVLAEALIESLRRQAVILPAINVIPG